MLPSERHEIILQEAARQPAVSIRYLTDRLGVSRETIRKDIELLAQAGDLIQVRGGATKVRQQEPPLADRSLSNPEGKSKIGKCVAGMIPDGASIIIDNGSTTLAAARELVQIRSDLIVYTNDLIIASVMADSADVTVLGGRLNPLENATMGLDTLDHLGRFYAEYSLIGNGGISADALFTDFSLEATTLRQLMMQHSQTPLILADHSKFGVVGQVAMKPLPPSAALVVDESPTGELAEALAREKLKIYVA